MVIQVFSDLIGLFLNLIRLSDAAFHNLLGLLLVIVLLRLLPPLYKKISKELKSRNEIVDLAETDCCTEFDVFVMALEFYAAHKIKKKLNEIFSSISVTGLTFMTCHTMCVFI